MRLQFLNILLLFLLFGCSNQKPIEIANAPVGVWSNDSIKKYFKDSIALSHPADQIDLSDSLNNFAFFSKRFFSHIKSKNLSEPLIYSFEEPYIDTTSISKDKKWFRIIINPCFSIPYCITAERIENDTKLTTKMTNGFGCYYPGFLTFTNIQYKPDSLYNSISRKLEKSNFWDFTNDTTCAKILDGEFWTVEAIENGKYKLITLHSPDFCSSQQAKSIVDIVDKLRDLTKLNEFIDVKMKTINKVIPSK